jgi:hypothetical protein
MGGGLLQLVAYGAQDVYLTGNPQITFWKVSYRRYTNFSMELIEQSLTGSSTIAAGQTKGNCTISRNGDLVGQIYIMSSTPGITNGSQIIQDVEVSIGGQRIDKHFNEWMLVWNELTTPESKAIGLKSLIGDIGTTNATGTTGVANVIIPLSFWFCRNPGLALPLIALQYHEVKLLFTFGTTAAASVGIAASIQVFCNYIFLDTDERRRMAQNPHEYLIDQVQQQNGATATSIQLNFNHPVKELIFTETGNGFAGNANKCNIKLNGQDRFSPQSPEYFQILQPLEYHTAIPKQNLPPPAQLSTLDRQTIFTLPDGFNGAVLAAAAAVGDVNAAEINFATNFLTISPNANFTATSIAQLGAGAQIRLTVGTSVANVTSAPAAALADEYYATIISVTTAPVVGGTVAAVFVLSPPVTATAVPKVLTTIVGTESRWIINLITNGNSSQARTSKLLTHINVYSFAIRPEEHQPSGTCNFSRIDSATLNFTNAVAISNIYAVNYNVLRIMSGMGGLAYSN